MSNASMSNELRELIETGPMAHLVTTKSDGTPQVSVIWIGLDGDELVSGHMSKYAKLHNINRDPRVVLSFESPRDRRLELNPYAVLFAHARVQPSEHAWGLLNDLAKVYRHPGAQFSAPQGPGYIVRYSINRISGVGSWAS